MSTLTKNLMMKSAVTISLVEQARKGPFVFHDDLPSACRGAADLGYDAIELFASSGEAIRALPLPKLLAENQLKLAAVGTGAGMILHRLSLCDVDSSRRAAAISFVREIISAGAEHGAPAIIGSMQGTWDNVVGQETAISCLRDSLQLLGDYATQAGTLLFYEPLNRYETNIANTLSAGLELLRPLPTRQIRLLADLFHMNIEEVSSADALTKAGAMVGHVHFVDSNRQAAGQGHINFSPIAKALVGIGYNGYASVEAFPIPDSMTTARRSIESFRQVFLA